MGRIFDEHLIRRVKKLDGMWKFLTDPDDSYEKKGDLCELDTDVSVSVPGVWNTERGLLTYEGVAWYGREFYFDSGTLRLDFGAVMTEAKVWLDGRYIGYHYGGFSQFDLIVPDLEAGSHFLTVKVDNRFDGCSIPQKKVDWYHYGGIIRSVSAETLRGISVVADRFEYTLSDDLSSVNGRFVLDVYNADRSEATDLVRIYISDGLVCEMKITLGGHERKEIVTDFITLSDIRLWDVGSPCLYDVRIVTGTDDLNDRIGFREISVSDGRVLLNKKEIEFCGVNRHEEHPDWGFAFPLGLMKRDLDIAVNDLGCNSIRGSHYPNSRELLDMLDERGIMFWSEIPMWGWGFSRAALGDERVVERGLEMHREMVKYYYNHPSIVIWGMHNEILTTTEEARSLSEKFYNFLKERGGNRLVTFATDKVLEDICLEYCDVISINKYYGWYEGGFSEWNEFLSKVKKRKEDLGISHIPVIMSEFGGAAIYGHHTFDGILWTEEYQAELMEYTLELFHNDPMVVGSFIWQFCDIRTCAEVGLNRARGFNNKGLLSEYRKPKAAFYKVSKLYKRFLGKN